MTFSVGIFDLFTYLTPGSLYLTLITYLAISQGWVPPDALNRQPVTLVLILALLLGYVLGNATYGLGRIVDRGLPFWHWDRFDARRTFAEQVPAAIDSRMIAAPWGVLLSAAELHNREVAAEATRMRAIGLMLRNATVPLFIGAALAAVEAGRGFGGAAAILAGPVLLAVAGGAAWRSVVLRFWAELKTLEICFVIPDIEDRLRGPGGAAAG